MDGGGRAASGTAAESNAGAVAECAVGKPRRPDANPRAARALHPGRLSFWLLFFGEALRRRSGANAAGGPEGAEGRRPGVKKSDSDAEGGRNRARSLSPQRVASSHRDQSSTIETRDASPSPRGRAFRRSYMEPTLRIESAYARSDRIRQNDTNNPTHDFLP
jgi:hypothetical protein